MNENKLREQICVLATSIFDRGLTHGSTGNISVRLDDNNILVTPSGSSFGRLDPKQIVKVTKSGEIIGSTTPKISSDAEIDIQPTLGFQRVIQRAVFHVQSSGKTEVKGSNVLVAIFSEKECQTVFLL